MLKTFALFSLLLVISLADSDDFGYISHGQDWDVCNTEDKKMQQSPINLTRVAATNNHSYIFADFRSAKANGTHYHTTLYIKAASSTSTFGQLYTVTADGKPAPFSFNQVRFRSHSEHTIDGKYYDLQVQVFGVNLYPSGLNLKLAVGLLFQISDTEDPFLAEVIKASQATEESTITLNVDLSHLLNQIDLFDYFFYLGSSTMPPCNSGKLYWIVPDKIFKMTQQQSNFFFNLYNTGLWEGNWRQAKEINQNLLSYSTFGSM